MVDSTPLTPEQRTMRARLAAHTRWSNATADDRSKQGRAAQRGLLERFAREVDPTSNLDPEDRYSGDFAVLQEHAPMHFEPDEPGPPRVVRVEGAVG